MSEPFDAYRKWLGIPPKEQPPNHYRLLGIANFEDDPDVIENAATRQIVHVRTFQSGKHSAISQKILNELSSAKICLLNPQRKAAYDEELRTRLAAEGKLSSGDLLVPSELVQEVDTARSKTDESLVKAAASPQQGWRTDTDFPPEPEPPIVPISMPLGTAVAPQASPPPELSVSPVPMVRSGGRYSYRPKKHRSAAFPIAITVIGLLIIVGGGIAALIYSRILSFPPVKPPPKKAASSATFFPSGSGKGISSAGRVPQPVPAPASDISSSSASPSLEAAEKKRLDPGILADRVRQAIFLGRQALRKRDATACKQHLATAEKLLDENRDIDVRLSEQVQEFRALVAMWNEFWSLVREAAIGGKVRAGERFQFDNQEYELVSHEGGQVKYNMGDQQHTCDLMDLHAKMAMALVFQTTAEDKSAQLRIIAFALVDEKASEESVGPEWAKEFYNQLASSGHTHAGLARELGVPEKPEPEKSKEP